MDILAKVPSGGGNLNWALEQDEIPDKSDAWSEALNQTFLSWTLAKNVSDQFHATVRQRSFSDYKLLHCRCGLTVGERTKANTSKTDKDMMAILLVEEGNEYVEIGGRGFDLKQGSILLWDSERTMKFNVRSPLEKLTLFAPSEVVQSVIPFARDKVGVLMDGSSGPGFLLAEHLKTLERTSWTLSDDQLNRSIRGTLELLSQAFSGEGSSEGETSYKRLLLERIRMYALKNLGDPQLTPTTIAHQFQISTRYLHQLFKLNDETVSAWLKKERLRRCHDVLLDPAERHRSITEIALNWGFQDMSHFSKAFRQEFDRSPRDLR